MATAGSIQPRQTSTTVEPTASKLDPITDRLGGLKSLFGTLQNEATREAETAYLASLQYNGHLDEIETRKARAVECRTEKEYDHIAEFKSEASLLGEIQVAVAAGVFLILGLYIVAEITGAMPDLPSESPLEGTMDSVVGNIGTGFGLMGLSIVVLGAVVILGMVAGSLGGNGQMARR